MSEDLSDSLALESQRLMERIRPLLAGQKSEVVAGALADLLAIWLASHRLRNDAGTIDAKATDKLRASLLRQHMAAVRELVPPNAAILYGEDG